MAAKKKEEVKPVEIKRNSDNDVKILLAAIFKEMEEIKKYVQVLEKYQRLDHGGEL